MDLTVSNTQIQKAIPQGGSLASSLIGLAKPLIKPALKALASGGLCFGVEKALKGIFGSDGYGPKERKQMIKLNDLLGKCPSHHLEAIAREVGSGTSQKGVFLRELAASIGIPMAIDLVKKLIGGGVHVSPPPVSKGQGHGQGRGKGMQINPPPFYGEWTMKRRGHRKNSRKKGRNS